MPQSTLLENYGKTIGIIDLGSAQIDGAIVRIVNGEPQEVFAEARETANFQDIPSSAQFQFSIEKKLDKVMRQLAGQNRIASPTEFFVFLSSPFFSSQIKTLRAREPQAVLITPSYIKNMLDQDLAPLSNQDFLLEDEVMEVKLNGYANTLLNQDADLIELQRFTSWGMRPVLNSLQNLIKNYYPFSMIKFQTFLLAACEIFKNLLPNNDFILFDTDSELADILIIKNGILASHLTFPGGKNFLIRELAKKLNTVPVEAETILNLYAGNVINRQSQARIKPALEEFAPVWQDYLRKSLLQAGNSVFLPETIYLIGDKPIDNLIADFIETANLNDITFSPNGPKTIFVEKLLAESIRHLTGQNPPLTNTWPLAEAIFCAKIKT